MSYPHHLLDVERPGRYEGLEGSLSPKAWDETALRVALAFPDTYEIGMSHLGLPILYDLFNSIEGVLAERAYAPWPDMEQVMREKGMTLLSRETGHSLSEFDLIGFTLQYELCATNVLAMLDLGDVPILSADRADEAPIVIGGGPVAANPEPFADFFDLFLIGDGEEAVAEIASKLLEAKEKGLSRSEKIEALGTIEGVYSPLKVKPLYADGKFTGFAEGSTPVHRRILADLETTPPPRPIPSFGDTVHNRLAIEIARGCTRGCRFCQAGFLYRPVREREPASILKAVTEGLALTGQDEVGLLSLSTGDYSCIGPLLVNLMDEHQKEKVSVSLPSLRIDNLDPRLAEEVSRVRKSGFTLAPEAGSERLRKVVNKDFTDETIIESVKSIFAAGWKGVKLYFMIGLPTETEEDYDALNQLVRKIAGLAPGGKSRITVSISNFVPKTHTPFQWAAQMGMEETREIQKRFRNDLPGKRVQLKMHDPATSILEGVIARGDRRVGKAILAAYRLGCRMDGWTSEFDWDKWQQAMAQTGLDYPSYLRERNTGEPLPWDMVDAGASRSYLLSELKKALAGEATGDCRTGECTGCGLCDFETLEPLGVRVPMEYGEKPESPPDTPVDEQEEFTRVRFTFSKTGPARYLSHLETTASLVRGIRAAGLPLIYSKGFNPHPKVQLGAAMPLGTESLSESGEMRLKYVPPLAKAVEEVNSKLPQGLKIDSMWVLNQGSGGFGGVNTIEEFMLTPSIEATQKALAAGGWDKLIENFDKSQSFEIIKRRKNKPDRVIEAKTYVRSLLHEGEGLRLVLKRDPDGRSVSPEALVSSLAGLGEGVRALTGIVKERTTIL